jgi:hypothetical protein
MSFESNFVVAAALEMRPELLFREGKLNSLNVFFTKVIVSDVEEMKGVGILDEKTNLASSLH